MATAKTERTADAREAPAALAAILEEIRSRIEARRERVRREIGAYPMPIPACDVHFNRLLEERASLAADLDRLDRMIAASHTPHGDLSAVEALVAECSAIDNETKPALQAALQRVRETA